MLFTNVTLLNTKNGLRIAEENPDNCQGKVLAEFIDNKMGKKLCKYYSGVLNVPIYNHAKDF